MEMELKTFVVKNLFGIQDFYLQVFMSKMTHVIGTQLFLKPPFSDMNRLATFHSYIDRESVLRLRNTRECVNLDSIFLLLPTNSCCKQLVTNWQLCIATFLAQGSQPIAAVVNHRRSHTFYKNTIF